MNGLLTIGFPWFPLVAAAKDFSTRRLEVDPLRSAADADGPSLGRRLKRSETWAAPKDPKLMVPKLPLPGAVRATATRPQAKGWFFVVCFFLDG